MLRIADLLNNIGEDDSRLADADGRRQVKLGRSVSAPERGTSVTDNQEAALAMMAMVDEDDHAASCPEDKHSPRYVQTLTRLRSYSRFELAMLSMPRVTSAVLTLALLFFSRIQEKAAIKRSPRRLSPYGSQQLVTIRSIVNPGEPTEASGPSSRSPSKKTAAGGKKRSTRSLFPELSESERRAKQRLIVKRCYYKKISLRNEASTLEQQFRSALRAMQQEDETTKAAGRGDDVKLREMFIDTLTTKEILREENIRLRRLADEYYMKNQGRLRQLLDSNHKGLILFTAAVNED
ncbi:unnamed protein product [Phytophthora lilii]|uniref:Unnamed protein product n=1 Tax=Phytophthora lilii TaxID=2077276 RepID=A0A9W6THX0_9STRA|nr:unnamed protein product [Phytophthora lilii]